MPTSDMRPNGISAMPPGWHGPRPAGGVGGTRRGVKCLHAHYAWHLVGGDDPVGRWVAAQLAQGQAAGPRRPGERWVTYAAVDCGTLSTRLLISSPDREPIVRLMRVTGLGQGVDRTRSIRAEAAERTLSVLREYRGLMEAHEVSAARMAGTSALRDATNRASFSRAAEEIVGTPLSLLSGQEEAALSFLGATEELDAADGPWLVADIGGGSTELVVGPDPAGARSLDLGCVRVTERFLHDDPPTNEQLAAARGLAERPVR